MAGEPAQESAHDRTRIYPRTTRGRVDPRDPAPQRGRLVDDKGTPATSPCRSPLAATSQHVPVTWAHFHMRCERLLCHQVWRTSHPTCPHALLGGGTPWPRVETLLAHLEETWNFALSTLSARCTLALERDRAQPTDPCGAHIPRHAQPTSPGPRGDICIRVPSLLLATFYSHSAAFAPVNGVLRPWEDSRARSSRQRGQPDGASKHEAGCATVGELHVEAEPYASPEQRRSKQDLRCRALAKCNLADARRRPNWPTD